LSEWVSALSVGAIYKYDWALSLWFKGRPKWVSILYKVSRDHQLALASAYVSLGTAEATVSKVSGSSTAAALAFVSNVSNSE